MSQRNSDNDISQQTFAWTGEIPVALVRGSYVGLRPGDQTRRDFVVITNSGEALVFENTVADNLGVGAEPTFAEPKIFPIDIGAGSAVNAANDYPVDDVVMVAFPQSGLVRVYKPVDLVTQ